ncbi:AraC family transcriptional regulator [Virgisporangium aliadipatigenens]|uniref:AraC family transcriptional regulator n=1 Tax=Virgisporangium aliadipatigenens TaxID=741659 RepID=UPI001EF163DE|nr:AraC family transcriptional regulator [Virgisporangium aliadipatigenens]
MDVISEAIGAIHAGRPSASSVRESGAWGMRLPAIEGMGFHVVLHGTGWLITAADQPVRLRAGDVVLVPHGTQHGLSHTAASEIGGLPPLRLPARRRGSEPTAFEVVLGCYRLDRGQVHRFLRDLPPVIAISPDYDRHPEMRAVIELLTMDVSGSGPGTSVTRPALIDLMLVHALRHGQRQSLIGPEAIDPGIAAALSQIHTNPQRPWTVQQLGEVAGMSRTAFKRQFTGLLGKPPMTYLIDWRLTHGARVLRETTEPLATIARQVGYSSEYAFANAFRRKFGIAPGRFRNQATDTRNGLL